MMYGTTDPARAAARGMIEWKQTHFVVANSQNLCLSGRLCLSIIDLSAAIQHRDSSCRKLDDEIPANRRKLRNQSRIHAELQEHEEEQHPASIHGSLDSTREIGLASEESGDTAVPNIGEREKY